MLTGDDRRTAQAIADETDEYKSDKSRRQLAPKAL